MTINNAKIVGKYKFSIFYFLDYIFYILFDKKIKSSINKRTFLLCKLTNLFLVLLDNDKDKDKGKYY